MTRRTLLAAATAVAALILPASAMAWPAPQPGQPACIPNGDGTFTIVQNAQAPFPRGSHQPENGTCEGPVRPAPTPTPTPTPVPPTPVVPPTPAPSCTTGVCPCPPTTCFSNRLYVFHIRQTYLGRRVTAVRAYQQGLGDGVDAFLTTFHGGPAGLPMTMGRTATRRVTRGSDGHRRQQFQVAVDYRGLEFQIGELRSTTVLLRLGSRVPGERAEGRAGQWYVTQELNRNCQPRNGTLNRDTAQPNPVRVGTEVPH